MSTNNLHEKFDVLTESDVLIVKGMPVITDNLRHTARPYQEEAFSRFDYYYEAYNKRVKPSQLLFHMATGSGKTYIMAGLILYLYNKGYRNFLFFVNSTNIIEKTRDNFLNTSSNKYLFNDIIQVYDKQVKIEEVDNFQSANKGNINIVFTTVQGLHSNLNTPRENSLTYEDFEDKKVVLISDEAHHINAETKKARLNKTEEKEKVSWESTVSRLFNANNENLLLEFTATADMSHANIADKYSDKLLFDYPLKQFRIDGYSKEVKVLQADLKPIDRALQAVILNQYRLKVFNKNRLLIKPVILFKSEKIDDSKAFQEVFIKAIRNLTLKDLDKIRKSNPDTAIKKAFDYLEENNIAIETFIGEIKEDFSEDKLISVNSEDESKHKQLAVNSLEDTNNEYRAVFAVDKLNEGWDVLNLFDIVRLYDKRDAKAGKPGKTTMSEAQLIGRGARYCPFQVRLEQSKYLRKYDDDLENELRVCEELYYHSAYNPRYIQELNTALEEIGIKAKNSIERAVKLKDEFKKTDFYKEGYIFLNERVKYDRRDISCLDPRLINRVYKVDLRTGHTISSVAFGASQKIGISKKEKEYLLSDFSTTIVRKALNKLDFYKFSNLKKYLPQLKSITEFISSTDYLGNIRLDISGTKEQVENLSPLMKLNAAIDVLEQIKVLLQSENIEYKGNRQFKPHMLKDKVSDKVLNFALNESEDKEFGKSMVSPVESKFYLDLSKKDWYAFDDCFGTSEEKSLIRYIDKVYDKLKHHYNEIYLVRNERYFKIFNFEDGRPVEPDFVLFLVNNKLNETLHYQIFIEPKGAHLSKNDEWKEEFLSQLKETHKLEQLWNGRQYVIWGMPFYNSKEHMSDFHEVFSKLYEKDN